MSDSKCRGHKLHRYNSLKYLYILSVYNSGYYLQCIINFFYHNTHLQMDLSVLREWSLITGRGATKREVGGGGESSEVLPLQKGRGGGRKPFGHAEGGGGTISFEVVLIRELGDLAIPMGHCRRKKFSPCFGSVFFPFCIPPPPSL